MKHHDLTTVSWQDYELLDSGGDRKLERYGHLLMIRPETQALWKPAHPEKWAKAAAEFRWEEGKGLWRKKGSLPESWELGWKKARFTMKLTSFKHTGIFPEQAANWEWIEKKVAALANGAPAPRAQPPRVLNLFGYTGIASIVAAQAGAQVVHVDASNQSNKWSMANAQLSGVPAGGIKYLLEDALKFVEREARRGSMYDGLILDPPAFGRGPKGELWHIEDSLPRLLDATAKVLAKRPGAFFLLNGYAAGYTPQSFLQAAQSAFPGKEMGVEGEYGELRIAESGSERMISAGIYVRFSR